MAKKKDKYVDITVFTASGGVEAVIDDLRNCELCGLPLPPGNNADGAFKTTITMRNVKAASVVPAGRIDTSQPIKVIIQGVLEQKRRMSKRK